MTKVYVILSVVGWVWAIVFFGFIAVKFNAKKKSQKP